MPPVDGKQLREMRKQLGMSQTELAEKLGVSQVTVSGWETERFGMQQPEILRLAMECLRLKRKTKA